MSTASTVFDSAGRRAGTIDALGYRTTATLDVLNRVTGAQDALGFISTTGYDALGRVETQVDAVGRRSTTVYDSLSRRSAEVNALGYRTSAVYSARDERIGQINARGYRTTGSFDARKRPVSTEDSLGRRITLAYDGRDALVRQTNARGQIQSMGYDSLGQLVSMLYADNTRVTLSYDAAGQPLVVADVLGLWTRTYDPVGLWRTEVGPDSPLGHPLTCSYDGVGNRLGLATWQGLQTYSYDPRNQNTLLQDIAGGLTTWNYDARQMILRQDNANGTRTTTTYDGAGQVLQVWHAKSDETNIEQAFYRYDAVGNPEYKRTLNGYYTYSYDALNQLISENAPIQGLLTWSYDPNGNRATEISPTGIITHSYDATDALISTASGAALTTISYDAAGCRVLEEQGAQRTTYTWDPSDRLLTLSLPSGTILTNSYRADGLRHRKVEGSATQQMVWDGSDVLGWVDGAGALGQFYSRGAMLARGHRAGGVKRVYHADALGTVEALTDQAQLLETSYRLNAWGRVLSGTAPENAFLYVGQPGYWYEGTPDGYYVRARWFDPKNGNWMSRDPMGPAGGDMSLFRYVRNRPTTAIDPSGRQLILLELAVPLFPWIALGLLALILVTTWYLREHPTCGMICEKARGMDLRPKEGEEVVGWNENEGGAVVCAPFGQKMCACVLSQAGAGYPNYGECRASFDYCVLQHEEAHKTGGHALCDPADPEIHIAKVKPIFTQMRVECAMRSETCRCLLERIRYETGGPYGREYCLNKIEQFLQAMRFSLSERKMGCTEGQINRCPGADFRRFGLTPETF